MASNEEALKLVQKCLDDWPYAATRVVDIMTRLEMVKALLEKQEAIVPIEKDEVAVITRYRFDCPCGTPLLVDQPYCAGCGKAVKWK